jgi:hypothetical protein
MVRPNCSRENRCAGEHRRDLLGAGDGVRCADPDGRCVGELQVRRAQPIGRPHRHDDDAGGVQLDQEKPRPIDCLRGDDRRLRLSCSRNGGFEPVDPPAVRAGSRRGGPAEAGLDERQRHQLRPGRQAP